MPLQLVLDEHGRVSQMFSRRDASGARDLMKH
jgi:hypothetical protein